MTDKTTGGCLCGKIRYACEGPLPGATYCHCKDCRISSGSAFHVGIPLDGSRFNLTAGETKGHAVQGESGHWLTRHFCADCGTQLYNTTTKRPGNVFLKAGTLDDPELAKPARQIWTDKAVSWAYIAPDLPTWPRAFVKG
ncbi:GFA family protein [Ruegeria sp.]|uniref:GFA family protein n=1 Tax=Ruegeria sp. TaxID=1879320 RepID=UPI00230B6B13|nr:GFA family protein [Ruegeria sp.]MDA7965552.1 GFA family protein [Ruegeria sp.]